MKLLVEVPKNISKYIQMTLARETKQSFWELEAEEERKKGRKEKGKKGRKEERKLEAEDAKEERNLGCIWEASGRHLGGIWEASGTLE